MKKNLRRKIIIIFLVGSILFILISGIVPPLFQTEIDSVKGEQMTQNQINKKKSSERVLCVDDNLDALLWRLRIIESAQEEIIFATYNFHDDESGKDVMSALLQAAERGVKVRMIVDGITKTLNIGRSAFFKTLSSNENVEIRIYNPVHLGMPWRLNYRMHDKYIVADNKAYILGGRNTKNVSLGEYQEKKDMDRDVVVYNQDEKKTESLSQVKDYFESIWNYKNTKVYKKSIRNQDEIIKRMEQHYISLKQRYKDAFTEINWKENTIATNGITLWFNPIESQNKKPILFKSLCNTMEMGKEIIIQTPYLICNQDMYQYFIKLNKGRNIRVITNAVENGANFCGCADYLNEKENILATGIDLFEYTRKQSSHTKTVLIDDNISIIGSFNFDIRSTYLDTELMLVIQSKELNKELREKDEKAMKESRCFYSDGRVEFGSNAKEENLGIGKKIFYRILRSVIRPFRHLL